MGKYVGWIQECINEGFAPSVCKSAAGYYIGATDDDGAPYARFSRDYYGTETEAKAALDSGTWCQRPNP